jgi:L-malate glycosyltransferase
MSIKTIHLNTERTWRGGERQMCYLVSGLLKRGHEATILCRDGSLCMEHARELGLPTRALKLRNDLDFLAARDIARAADELGADIVHGHTSKVVAPAAMSKCFAKRKLKTIAHKRVDFSIHKMPLRMAGLKYRWGTDRFIAITQAVKDVMVNDGLPPEKIEIIYSSTDLTRYANVERVPGLREELGIPEGAKVIGNLAALVGHKGQKYLLEAAAKVVKECPEAFFLILGEGNLRGELEAQAKALSITGRLSMPGFRDDPLQCMKELDIFCMSSIMEGMGSVVCEAMALELPTIVTRAGGLPEVIENEVDGLTVPSHDGPALADGILRLLQSPADAARFAAQARKTVEQKFSVETMVDRTIELYERLLGI